MKGLLSGWKRCKGVLLRGGNNCCKKGDYIGLLEENKVFLFMVCRTSSTLRLECNNDVQHLYMLQDIKLYIVGFQLRTLNLINDGMSEGMNNHYWEGRGSVVRISKLLKGLKNVHYLVCSER